MQILTSLQLYKSKFAQENFQQYYEEQFSHNTALMNFMFNFILSIKIFATVLKRENSKHHILQPKMIPCGLPKRKIRITQEQSGHSN